MTLTADNPVLRNVKRWTKQEYNNLVERGFLAKTRTFLFRGALVDKSDEGQLVTKRWSLKEYIDNVERGFLARQRVFLYHGELVEMPAMGSLHAQGVKRLNYWLVEVFRPQLEVRIQMPFICFDSTMPEPDGAVCTAEQDARPPHPSAALLLVEVSDSSIDLDQQPAFDYAASLVPEYWIVNVRDRWIEVFREPTADPTAPSGYRYAWHRILREGESISPLARPDAVVTVARLVATS